MWNEEGGDGEHRVVVPSESDLVGSIPVQGVQVVHEHRLLQVLPHQLVKKFLELTKPVLVTSKQLREVL